MDYFDKKKLKNMLEMEANVNNNLGYCFLKTGDIFNALSSFILAEAKFQNIEKEHFKLDECWYHIAMCYISLQDMENAEIHLQKS